MNYQLNTTIQELIRCIQDAEREAQHQSNKNSNSQSIFLTALDYQVQRYVQNMPSYLNMDHVVGFPIQLNNYSINTSISDQELGIAINIHYYPPVRPLVIKSPEMIIELLAKVDKSGNMEYRLSKYFANPEELQQLAKYLPDDECIVMQEDGSLSIEYIEEPIPSPVWNYSTQNYSMMGEDATAGSDPFSDNTWTTAIDWSNNGAGGVGTSMSKLKGSFRMSNGAANGSKFSPKYYESNWSGGSRARITTHSAAKWGSKISRGTVFVTIGLAAYNINEANKLDNRSFGYNTQVATAQTVVGIGGAMAGAQIGGAIGVWFGGVGAIPGSIIGGIIGGVLGGWGGSELGEAGVNLFY
ncbi:hypothetical protein [Labilibaculum filiforme]|uniref:hypothetical protein n=1 Tax=Labilibaculum filiforme TaxID=1940526 RepID=UPI000C6DEC9A|nr:hypothetical protein [Labilibaculum filiforme]